MLIDVQIEIPKGSRVKYEYDHETHQLRVDRFIRTPVDYFFNYGFIPNTLSGDGDPLDVLVMCEGPILPGAFVNIRPICYMVMEDEKGIDEKLLAVAQNDAHYEHVKNIEDIPVHKLNEISQFFETYKSLEKEKWVKVGGWENKEKAFQLINNTHDKYMIEIKKSTDSLCSLIDDDV